MTRRPYVPTQWDQNESSYLAGWRDAEAGAALGEHAPDERKGKYAKWAYEAGYHGYQAKHPQEGGGA